MRIVQVVVHENFQKAVQKAAAALLQGNVVVCPTDTVYGLLADATNGKAVRKVVQIKGRQQGKPLPIFVKDMATAKQLAKISLLQEKYIKKVWPGKITLVFKSRGVLPKETGTTKTIGLRTPNHVFLQMLLAVLGRPVVGTSANLAGKPPILDSKDIIKQFWKRTYKPDILLDAGKLPRSRPSRVIDIIGSEPKILRK